MRDNIIKEEIYIRPGYICLPKSPVNLYTVVGSGIVITIYDTKKKYGGMNYYIRPRRKEPSHSTPIYACPAIIGLLDMFSRYGSKVDDLEAHIYGGAENRQSESFIEGISQENVNVGLEILEKKNIRITGKDIGGDRGRKVVFNTKTGESIIAKVDKIRNMDWYPEVQETESASFNF